MRDAGVVRLGRPIDNSGVVRQVDPRSRRELLLLILLVSVLAAGLGLYAWPALEIRRAGQAGAPLDRGPQRPSDADRTLRLGEAAPAKLRRLEQPPTRQLCPQPPAPPARCGAALLPPPRRCGRRAPGKH